jgi:hypothetical protein
MLGFASGHSSSTTYRRTSMIEKGREEPEAESEGVVE